MRSAVLRGGLLNAACVRGEIAPLLPTLSLRLQRMVASSQAFQAAQCELSGGNLEGTITTSTKVAERRGFRVGWRRVGVAGGQRQLPSSRSCKQLGNPGFDDRHEEGARVGAPRSARVPRRVRRDGRAAAQPRAEVEELTGHVRLLDPACRAHKESGLGWGDEGATTRG